jgi:outer membrane lipoprotein-sorting protein
MSTLRNCLLSFVVAAFSCSAAAAPKTADDVIKFTTQKAGEYKTWSMDFRKITSIGGFQTEYIGSISYKVPGQTRVAMDKVMMGRTTNHVLIVVDADKVKWHESTMYGNKQYLKTDLTKIPSNSPEADTLRNPPQELWKKELAMRDYTLIGSDTLNGQPVFVLDGVLKKDAVLPAQEAEMMKMMGKKRLYIGKEDGFLRKAEDFDKENKTIIITMEHTNIKLNPDLPDSLFKYQPPKGVEVFDMLWQQKVKPTSQPALEK